MSVTFGMAKGLEKMPEFITINAENKVNNRIIADSFEAAEEFCGTGMVIVETESTGPGLIGYAWDGATFTPSTETLIIEEPVVEEVTK